MCKELKEDMEKVEKMMYEQNRSISREVGNLRRNQEEILELQSTVTMKYN